MKREERKTKPQKTKGIWGSLSSERYFREWALAERMESLPHDMLWRGPFEGFR